MNLEEYNCIFCKESFDSKEELQIHFRKHGDPKFNQSVKNTKGRLPNESQVGEKSNEDGEVVTCDVCSEVFPTISKAITHKHKVHPDHDAKYFCPWCGKLFTMKHLYNKHIQTIHNSKEENEETGFHCDYCDVDFFLSSAMVYHNKFFHRQDTELAAIGHSKKMKHFHQDLLPIYYCPFCGEEYYNKVNLHKHMGDDHSDENQSPDDILRCPLCEAIFYHLDAYELHLTFHSTEDLYNEENEIAKDVTEFSLETVPPTMEKVENESQDDNETTRTSIGFEELLQQVMNESNDNDNSNNDCIPEKKSKKRKKHKKSKKSAITLDEFLNMNKDVFGEGIDFQGIEEVPTQVVAKQLKKKLPPKAKLGAKMPLSDIAKLKKQGITVKKSRNNLTGMTGKNVRVNPVGKSVNVAQNVLTNTLTPSIHSKEKAKVASNEVLSKLLTQNNSQLKIVKKSSQDTSDINKSLIDDAAEKIECDSTQNDQVPLDTEANKKMERKAVKMTSNEKISTCNEEDQTKNDLDNITEYEDNESHDMNLSDLKGRLSNIDEINVFPMVDDVPIDSSDTHREESKNYNISNVNKSLNVNVNDTNALSALRNISQHITVKPMSSPKRITKQILPTTTNIDKECFDNPVSSSTVDEVQDEVIQENKIEEDGYGLEKNDNNINNCSLSALKRLSGLITVKSCNTTNKVHLPAISSKRTFAESDSEGSQNEGTDDEVLKEPINVRKIEKPEVQKHPIKSLDAIHNLSKHITIKSLNQQQKTDTEPSFDSDEFDHEDDSVDNKTRKIIDKNIILNKGNFKTLSNQSTVMKTVKNTKTTEIKNKSPPISGKMATIEQKADRKTNVEEENPMKKQLSNILKQLPNVTAKPVNITKSVNLQITTKSSAQSISSPKSNIIHKSTTKKQVQEEIEIFNIDDSDDEDVKNQITTQNQIEVQSTVGSPKVDTEVDRKTDILRNLSKNITVKSTSRQMQTSNSHISALKDSFDEDVAHDMNSDFSDDEANDIMNKSLKLMEQQKLVLQNTLKNLSKHISVKSANSSPKPAIKLDRPINSNHDMHENDDDDNSNSGSFSRVKITEMNDDDISEEDQNNADNNQFGTKITVQSPNYSNSDDENYEEKNELLLDNKFKGNTKVSQNPPQDLNISNKPVTLKNLPRRITVKSSKENKVDNTETSTQRENPVVPNLGNEMSIKPIRPKSVRQDISEPSSTSCSRQNTIKESANNQRFSSSSGQVNTVNKEVSVKTFQTETFIEEITTTVTKTIRTVNQTVKQEVRNTNTTQNVSLPSIRPPTVRGIRPNVQVKNFQGIQVRHGAPRIRNPIIRGRAPTGTVIRPSNQLVPFRPSINVARPSAPRMPTIRKATPSTIIAPKPVIGKPLKISPNAMMPSMKRTSEDSTGHFSCFKKPKESLIPVSEVFGFSRRGDSSIHFASSSQSRSNFSCTTTSKTVKGNSVVTSTQMKAEVSSSSEQLSRLSNMSGLKIVKTSHANQANVEEKSEISASKRNTLEAIEKLQKHGLLVKKPRFDEDHISENSNSDGDDGNFSDT